MSDSSDEEYEKDLREMQRARKRRKKDKSIMKQLDAPVVPFTLFKKVYDQLKRSEEYSVFEYMISGGDIMQRIPEKDIDKFVLFLEKIRQRKRINSQSWNNPDYCIRDIVEAYIDEWKNLSPSKREKLFTVFKYEIDHEHIDFNFSKMSFQDFATLMLLSTKQ